MVFGALVFFGPRTPLKDLPDAIVEAVVEVLERADPPARRPGSRERAESSSGSNLKPKAASWWLGGPAPAPSPKMLAGLGGFEPDSEGGTKQFLL